MADPANPTPEISKEKKERDRYRYIGPASALKKGRVLKYPGGLRIEPSAMGQDQIAALDRTHPDVIKKLWEKLA